MEGVMSICIAGKNDIAVDVCQYVIENYPQEQVFVITNRNDKGVDGFQRSFLKYAREKNLTICDLNDVYDQKDLVFISLEFDRIIKPSLFVSKRLFNIHFSLLPSYKGMYTSAIPLLNGENCTGVTLHCIEQGIDTGDIIAQKRISIGKNETCKSLYFKYIKKGTELVIQNIDNLIKDRYEKIPQPIENSTYYPKSYLDYSDIKIDLNCTAYQVAQQIAAYNFRDFQLPSIYGINVVGCEITDVKSVQRPGTVLHQSDDCFLIATIDYDLIVYKDCLDKLFDICKHDKIDDLLRFKFLEYYIREKEPIHGWSPLIIAAYNNSIRVFEFLLKCGADVNDRNYNGTTVMMYAKDAALKNNDNRIIDLCIEYGADPLLRDYKGMNLYDYLMQQSVYLLDYIKDKKQ